MWYTKSGLLVAKERTRLVVGGRGNYHEFATMEMNNLHIPEKEAYRHTPKWKALVFYLEYRSNDQCNVKVYYQLKLVGYADYKLGLYYVAEGDLVYKEE